MKKHIIAAAVAAAVAVPAMAQNVTISGALEAGYMSTKVAGVNDHTVSPSVLTTNNIKFSGTEDLGGGLKASFTITDEFATNSGAQTGVTATGATDGTAAGVFEETSIALSGDFGAVKIGRFNFASRDAGGVYRFGNEFARLSGDFRSLGSQPSNSIEYASPTFNGLQVVLSSSNGGGKAVGALGASTAVATVANQTGLSVNYANGPLQLRYAQTSADIANVTSRNVESFVAGQYDFGSFKIGALYGKETNRAAAAEDTTVTVLNAAIPLGSGMTLIGSYHDVTEETTGTATVTGLALTKDLSKRTTIYAGYVRVKNSAGMSFAYDTNGAGAAANNGSVGFTDSTAVAGVRHTF
jgi:hypothetical protein